MNDLVERLRQHIHLCEQSMQTGHHTDLMEEAAAELEAGAVTDELLYAAYDLGYEHGVEAEQLRHLPCCATYIGDAKQLRAALQKGEKE